MYRWIVLLASPLDVNLEQEPAYHLVPRPNSSLDFVTATGGVKVMTVGEIEDRILADLIEVSENQEWLIKGQDILKSFQSLVVAGEIDSRLYENLQKKLKSASGHPKDFLYDITQLESSVQARDFLNPHTTALISSLRNTAYDIIRKQSILVIPEHIRSVSESRLRELAQKIATELYESIQYGAGDYGGCGSEALSPSRIGILRWASDTDSQTQITDERLVRSGRGSATGAQTPKNEHPNLSRNNDFHAMIIRELQTKTAEALIRREHDYLKEGPILLEGNTGTGKSLAAELIAHWTNKRCVYVNIAAITPSLLESRMRGYEEGTFTDAKKALPGWFEEAHNGVLFLDELQSAPTDVQAQLLDLLSAVSDIVRVSRMGKDAAPRKCRVKVIIAVNEPVKDLLKSGRLREDFVYRIRSVIHFPALSEMLQENDASRFRGQNTKAFLATLLTIYRWKAAPCHNPSNLSALFPTYDPEALELIRRNPWKGNFRELETFAFDIFWQLDRDSKTRKVTSSLVMKELQKLSQRWDGVGVRQGQPSLAQANQENVLRAIENALREEGFVIERALRHLGPLNVRSRPKLRSLLNENYDILSPDVRDRLARFLKKDAPSRNDS